MYSDYIVDLSEGGISSPNAGTGTARPTVASQASGGSSQSSTGANASANASANANASDKLKLYEEFLAFLIINFYEYFLGLVVGFLFNFAMFKAMPFKNERGMVISFLLVTILVSIIISTLFILRKSSQYLPYVDKAFEKGLKHPPPVAITFSLWRTLNQIKLYSKHILKKMYNLDK